MNLIPMGEPKKAPKRSRGGAGFWQPPVKITIDMDIIRKEEKTMVLLSSREFILDFPSFSQELIKMRDSIHNNKFAIFPLK